MSRIIETNTAQETIWTWVRANARSGYSPSVSEIADGMGISKDRARDTLDTLVKVGRLRRVATGATGRGVKFKWEIVRP